METGESFKKPIWINIRLTDRLRSKKEMCRREKQRLMRRVFKLIASACEVGKAKAQKKIRLTNTVKYSRAGEVK